jgi:hypothetical protein
MKMILRNMLLAACVTSLPTSLRAQSTEVENSGASSASSTSKQEESGGDTDAGKKEIQEPAGEPKGTNTTGAEKDDDRVLDPLGADATEEKDRAIDAESSETHSQK